MAEQKTTALAKADYGTQVIKRMDELTQVGFALPKDYNYVNAIKASMLVLADLKDRNGRPAMEVCTPASIQQALFEMCQKGLNVAKKQGYFIVKGDKLCLDDSYFGKALQVKRVFPNWEPNVGIVYEGDNFLYEIDPETSRKKLIKHEQNLGNLDGNFIAAYMYLPCADGGKKLYVMTRRAVLNAWSQSPNKSQTVHGKFPEKMIEKTVINTGCNMVINSTPELSQSASSDDEDFAQSHTPIDVPSHEVTEVNPDEIPVAEVVEPKPETPKNAESVEEF